MALVVDVQECLRHLHYWRNAVFLGYLRLSAVSLCSEQLDVNGGKAFLVHGSSVSKADGLHGRTVLTPVVAKG